MENNPVQTPTPLLTDAAGVGHLLGISRASVFNLQATGQLPRAALRRGKIVRWSIEEIRAWTLAGTPSMERWEVIKQGSKRS
jgi:predicted DNA-binding transcriptional regulator AlpA